VWKGIPLQDHEIPIYYLTKAPIRCRNIANIKILNCDKRSNNLLVIAFNYLYNLRIFISK